MTFLRQVWSVMYKDLLVELRTPSRLSGLFFFALALLIMVAFSTGSSSRILQQIAGGTLWLGLLLASTRSLDQSFVLELEHGALEGLVLWPVSPAALYYGKAIANTFILLAVLLALCPLTIAMFNVHLPGNYGLFAGFLLFGSGALAAPGTLYAAITTRARGASVLLPLLLFPLVVPALMAAARGTTLLFEGDPMDQTPMWFSLLVTFNILHWALSGVLFRFVVEDS